MKKFKLEEVEEALAQVESIEESSRKQAVEFLRQLTEQEVEEESLPKPKKQFVVVVYDNECALDLSGYTGAVFQLNEGENPSIVVDKVQRACQNFNKSKKGKKNPVKHISEAVEAIPNRWFIEECVWRKQKEPVYLFATNGKVLEPTE